MGYQIGLSVRFSLLKSSISSPYSRRDEAFYLQHLVHYVSKEALSTSKAGAMLENGPMYSLVWRYEERGASMLLPKVSSCSCLASASRSFPSKGLLVAPSSLYTGWTPDERKSPPGVLTLARSFDQSITVNLLPPSSALFTILFCVPRSLLFFLGPRSIPSQHTAYKHDVFTSTPTLYNSPTFAITVFLVS